MVDAFHATNEQYDCDDENYYCNHLGVVPRPVRVARCEVVEKFLHCCGALV